jgi:dTDP-glucose pyrophosphorylase
MSEVREMGSDLNDFIIGSVRTIREAMQQTDRSATRCLLVVDERRHLVGAVTDGDIRRGILAGRSLTEPVATIMNRSPRSVSSEDIQAAETARRLMNEHHIDLVPAIDDAGIIHDVHFRYPVEKRVVALKRDNPVFLQAGGIGSRMEPFTRILPKPLIPLGDKPVIEVIMDRFAAAGFSRFIVSVRYKSEMIRAYFADEAVRSKYASVEFVEETFPMGTVGSLALARSSLDRPFFLTNCDVLLDSPLEAVFASHEAGRLDMTIVGCNRHFTVPYGVLQAEEGILRGVQEKPTYTHLVNTGVYILSPDVLSFVSEDRRTDMDTLLAELLDAGKRIGIHEVDEASWHDVGEWEPYRNALRSLEQAHGG